MAPLKRWTSIAAITAALAAGACSDANEPGAVDPATVASGMAGLASSFSSNIGFQSLRELAPSFTFTAAGAAGAAVAATVPRLPGEDVGVPLTEGQRHALLQFALHAPEGALAIFPVDVLGKTFVWDTAQHKYVKSLTATGAPSNGVRFVLYLVDPLTHQPTSQMLTVGYVDLTDLSTAQANKVGVLVKYGTQTIASYTITGIIATNSITLGAVGYVTDGMSRLDFDLSMVLSSSAITMDYSLSGSNGFHADLAVTASLTTGAVTILWQIAYGGNSVDFDGSFTATAVNCQVKFNGSVVATMTGNPDNPTITGAGGHTFTAADLTALRATFDAFGELMDQVDGVFGPAFLVF